MFKLDKNANKYSRGKCNVVAGCDKFPGAAILCARASERMGSGYTQIYTHESNVKSIAVAVPTCPTSAFESLFDDASFSDTPVEKPVSYVVGPGFTDTKDTNHIVDKILSSCSASIVVDGGALGKHVYNERCVLTPHAGEARRLSQIYNTKPELLSKVTGACVVLKGPDTVIFDGDRSYVMKLGGPALAKAGSGDVLAGVIGSLLLRFEPFKASVIGATIHALAGNIASKKFGEVSVVATDLIDVLPEAILEFLNNPSVEC